MIEKLKLRRWKSKGPVNIELKEFPEVHEVPQPVSKITPLFALIRDGRSYLLKIPPVQIICNERPA